MNYDNAVMRAIKHGNLVIMVSDVGVTKDFTCLISDRIVDLEVVGKNQCFPLFWYEEIEAALDITSDPIYHQNQPQRVHHLAVEQ